MFRLIAEFKPEDVQEVDYQSKAITPESAPLEHAPR